MADVNPQDRAAAREFTNGHLTVNMDDVRAALADAYGDSYVTGLLIGAQQTGTTLTAVLGQLAVPTTDADWAAFWDSWTPGSIAAANLLRDGGLADLLDQVDVTIAGMTGTLLDGLGNRLADGVAAGLGVDEITDSLGDWLDDPARALIVARTETARAVSAATLDGYGEAGVGLVDWLVSPGACPECEDYGSSGPYPTADVPDLPAHPNCRCSYAPVNGSASDTGAGEGE